MVGPKRDQREGDHSLIGSARARHYARTSASHEANEGCDSARRQNSMIESTFESFVWDGKNGTVEPVSVENK
jgi:hypothetical protein